VFGFVPGVLGWQPGGRPGAYVLQTNDPDLAAPAVVRALVAVGANVTRVAEVEHSLEDVYLELVVEPQRGPQEEAARAGQAEGISP
jgi:hypothetical protein